MPSQVSISTGSVLAARRILTCLCSLLVGATRLSHDRAPNCCRPKTCFRMRAAADCTKAQASLEVRNSIPQEGGVAFSSSFHHAPSDITSGQPCTVSTFSSTPHQWPDHEPTSAGYHVCNALLYCGVKAQPCELPREAVESPSLELRKERVIDVLRDMV